MLGPASVTLGTVVKGEQPSCIPFVYFIAYDTDKPADFNFAVMVHLGKKVSLDFLSGPTYCFSNFLIFVHESVGDQV